MGLHRGLVLLSLGVALIILSIALVSAAVLLARNGILPLLAAFAPAAVLVAIVVLIKDVLELRSARRIWRL